MVGVNILVYFCLLFFLSSFFCFFVHVKCDNNRCTLLYYYVLSLGCHCKHFPMFSKQHFQLSNTILFRHLLICLLLSVTEPVGNFQIFSIIHNAFVGFIIVHDENRVKLCHWVTLR